MSEEKIIAKCPVCKQSFVVPRHLFYSNQWSESTGLYSVPSDRALYYHKVNGRYCVSNGVVKNER